MTTTVQYYQIIVQQMGQSKVNYRVRNYAPFGHFGQTRTAHFLESFYTYKYKFRSSRAASVLQQESVLTFQGTRFLVCTQVITIPALAVIGGIAVDTYVFAVMSHGTGVHTWNKTGLKGRCCQNGSTDEFTCAGI